MIPESTVWSVQAPDPLLTGVLVPKWGTRRSNEAQSHAAEIKIQAERKADGLLADLERGNVAENLSTSNVGHRQPRPNRQTLDSVSATRQDPTWWRKKRPLINTLHKPIVTSISKSDVEVSVKGTLLRDEKAVGDSTGEATTLEFPADSDSAEDRYDSIRTARMVATGRMRINLILEYTPARDIFRAGDVLF